MVGQTPLLKSPTGDMCLSQDVAVVVTHSLRGHGRLPAVIDQRRFLHTPHIIIHMHIQQCTKCHVSLTGSSSGCPSQSQGSVDVVVDYHLSLLA